MYKIALGTAQFGLDYGINNKRGKIPPEEVFKILEEAGESGIDTLDTAYAYGDSEKIIGEYLKKKKSHFKVISKLPPCDIEQAAKFFTISLEHLKTDKLYGYLLHEFETYPEIIEKLKVLEKFKKSDKVSKIGFSLYYPEQLKSLISNNIHFDIIQIPYNIFDQRFLPFFPLLKKRHIEVHIRSVFLQGLILKSPQEINNQFIKIKDKLSAIHSLSQESNIPISALCLNFAVTNKFIDKVIIGIDNIEHLRINIKSLEYERNIANVYARLAALREDDENIILPTHWKLQEVMS